MQAILKFGNMESQKRPRSEDIDNDTSVSKKFPRIAIPIRSETKEAVKLLLSERKKKAERLEMKKFVKIQFLEELKKRIAKINENLHCEVEIISGHPSSSVLCFSIQREEFQRHNWQLSACSLPVYSFWPLQISSFYSQNNCRRQD